MAFLTPDKTRTEYGIVIKEKILPTKLKPNRKLSNGTGKVEYVTIHNTEDINEAKGTNDAEQYARATHNGNMGGVSVHYYIDETDCWQTLKEDEMGYHAADGKNGKGNTTSLAIEIIMDGSGSKADKGAEDRGAKLAAILLNKHGLSIERLTTHNRWYSKKYCPAYILPHWDEFKNKVKKYLDEIQDSKSNSSKKEESNATNSNSASGELYRVQTGAFRVKAYANNLVAKLKASGFSTYIVYEGGLYKVQVGAFSVKANAQAMLSKLKSAGYDGFIKGGSENTAKKSVKGDIDGDGSVTAADARLASRAAVGSEKLTDEQVERGDMDGDGEIDIADARTILRNAVGIEE